MKILVCISSVPDTTSKINFTSDQKAFDTAGIQFIINPADEFGLTKSIFLQESVGAKVTVLSVGDASVEPILRKALAVGADDAIRIDSLAEDPMYVAHQIARVVEEQQYDLIFTGKESLDYNGGVVPALIAAKTACSFINACTSINLEGNKAIAIRDLDGVKEKIEVPLPVIVAGQKGLVDESELKIPNMRGIMQARTRPLKVVEPVECPINISVETFEKPVSKAQVKMISADNLDELITLLREDAKAF